jgi:hypothetical protein
MPIEAPCSKHKKKNLIIYIAACLIFGFVFAYDGYLSKYEWSMRHSFYQKHVVDGQPDDTMMFNKKAPVFLVVLAIGIAAWLKIVLARKVIASEQELIINNRQKIPYDSIQKINKTYFNTKGFFVITYETEDGQAVEPQDK